MDLEELNQHFDLIQKLNDAKEMHSVIEAKSLGGQALDGMPHGTGVSDKVGALASALADLKGQIEYLEKEIQRTAPPIEDFISEIEEPKLRPLFRFRFLYGLSYTDIANVLGPGTTAESVQMRFSRYLKKRFDC